MAERAQALNDRWAKLGCDVDLSGLFYGASAAMSSTS
jgi:hypothetical protein